MRNGIDDSVLAAMIALLALVILVLRAANRKEPGELWHDAVHFPLPPEV